MIRSAAQRFVVALCLAGGLGIAAAQEVEPSDMVRDGLQAVQMIDQDKAGELWDGAAPVARKRVPRADFVALVAKAREPLGAPQQRTWVLVSRQAVNDTDPDASGQFVSVEYETRFANKATPVRELLSFHLDSDRIWRFSGYVLR